MDVLALQLLNGVAYAMILFLVASGFSLIFGTMGILNLAHGTLYMFGAYFGLTVARLVDNWVPGLLAGGVGVALFGLAIERGLLSRLYRQINEQVLLTLGIVYICANVALWVWGPFPMIGEPPSILSGSVDMGEVIFPVYRPFLILIVVAVFIALWWLQDNTRVGAIIRAGMDDKEMTIGLGINYRRVCSAVFASGALLVGLAGFLGAPILGTYHEIAWEILPLALIVVVVGGVGSVQGTLLGSILIGLIDALGKAYFPDFSLFTIYLVLIIMLLVKPSGLLGRRV